MKTFLRSLLAFIIGAVLFWLLRGWRVEGGDTCMILAPNWNNLYWPTDHLVYYTREPLAQLVAHLFYLLPYHAHGPLGRFITQALNFKPGDLTTAFSLSSAFCGGLYLALLAWYCRRPVFWLLCLASATTWNFVGHIEFYAPVVVAMTLFYMLLARALEPVPRAKPVHVFTAFALAYMSHKGMLFFAPALLLLAWGRRGDLPPGTPERARWFKRPWPGRQWEWSLIILILMVVVDVTPGFLVNAGYLNDWLSYMPVNEPLSTLVTPLTRGMAHYFESRSQTGMFYVYTFGTWKHWAYFFSFLAVSAPLGLPVFIRKWRAALATDAGCALALASLCGIIWIFLWQPRGFWKDWDLFCLPAIPLNLLAGSLLAGLHRPAQPVRDEDGEAVRNEYVAPARDEDVERSSMRMLK